MKFPLPAIIAHRGASHRAPGNTLAAFKLAWEEGADGIEGDFHLTRDGQIVCIHDADTKRSTGVKRVVARTDWKELAQLDAGSWKGPGFAGERLPLLSRVLDLLPVDKFFFIEIKCGCEIIPALAGLLADRRADPRRVMIIASDPEVVSVCRTRLPAFEAHWISELEDFAREGGPDACLRTLESSHATGLQFKSNAPVAPEWIAALRARGMKTAAWIVDDLPTARRVMAIGVDFMTTNHPARLRAWLNRR